MGKPKNPGKLAWFLFMLLVRIAVVFALIGLIAYGVWALLYAVLT